MRRLEKATVAKKSSAPPDCAASLVFLNLALRTDADWLEEIVMSEVSIGALDEFTRHNIGFSFPPLFPFIFSSAPQRYLKPSDDRSFAEMESYSPCCLHSGASWAPNLNLDFLRKSERRCSDHCKSATRSWQKAFQMATAWN